MIKKLAFVTKKKFSSKIKKTSKLSYIGNFYNKKHYTVSINNNNDNNNDNSENYIFAACLGASVVGLVTKQYEITFVCWSFYWIRKGLLNK